MTEVEEDVTIPDPAIIAWCWSEGTVDVGVAWSCPEAEAGHTFLTCGNAPQRCADTAPIVPHSADLWP